MILRGSICATAVACLLIFTSAPVSTFYDDTHYSLTYYLARECGYTPMQAHRIASADLSIDYSPLTEPVQDPGKVLTQAELAVGTAIGGVVGADQAAKQLIGSAAAQRPRAAFHALRDETQYGERLGRPANPAAADGAIQAREQQLWLHAATYKNPGVLLHFVQDIPAHAGYSSMGGHWAAFDADKLRDPSRPMGQVTDYISASRPASERMVASTISVLRRFMLQNRKSARSLLPGCSAAAIARRGGMLDALTAANPIADGALQGKVNLKNPKGEPNYTAADAVVKRALATDTPAYLSQRISYEFNAAGEPAGQLDKFTLFGDVTVRLDRTSAADDVALSLWTRPTKPGEAPFQLECQTVAGTSTSGGPINPGLFRNVPVGNLRIRAITGSGHIVEQDLTLDRLEQETFLRIPSETKQPNECGKRVAQTTRNLCMAPRAAATEWPLVGDAQRVEEAFEKAGSDLDKEAEDCRDKQDREEQRQTNNNTNSTQPPTTTPPKTGGHAKTITSVITAGGATVAGLWAWNEYKKTQEEFDSLLSDLNTLPVNNTGNNTNNNNNNTSTAGTYTASVTRSCQVGAVNSNPLSPSFIEPCTQAPIIGSTCTATNFTITVSGSTVRDCGGWLQNTSLSGSTVTALYNGVCGSGGITVSGPLNGTLSGSGTCRGNNYTVSISTRRQ